MKLRSIRFTEPVAIPTITAATVKANERVSLELDDARTTVTVRFASGEVYLLPWATVSLAEVEPVTSVCPTEPNAPWVNRPDLMPHVKPGKRGKQ